MWPITFFDAVAPAPLVKSASKDTRMQANAYVKLLGAKIDGGWIGRRVDPADGFAVILLPVGAATAIAYRLALHGQQPYFHPAKASLCPLRHSPSQLDLVELLATNDKLLGDRLHCLRMERRTLQLSSFA
jgi:hypothetical protein